MSTPSTESHATKPSKDTAESLNAMLWAKADAELMAIIGRHINLKGLKDIGRQAIRRAVGEKEKSTATSAEVRAVIKLVAQESADNLKKLVAP